jgi:hypothetical protein
MIAMTTNVAFLTTSQSENDKSDTLMDTAFSWGMLGMVYTCIIFKSIIHFPI